MEFFEFILKFCTMDKFFIRKTLFFFWLEKKITTWATWGAGGAAGGAAGAGAGAAGAGAAGAAGAGAAGAAAAAAAAWGGSTKSFEISFSCSTYQALENKKKKNGKEKKRKICEQHYTTDRILRNDCCSSIEVHHTRRVAHYCPALPLSPKLIFFFIASILMK